jgi:hypothetical protein
MQVLRFRVLTAVAAACFVAAVGNLHAQSQEKGFNWSEEYRGSSTDLGQVTVLDSSLGYNINKYLGISVGLPVYLVHPAQDSLTNWHSWNDNFGDAYAKLRINWPNRFVNYSSTITGGAPTGSFARGFSTGRGTINWDNSFDRSFGRLTPFFNVGIGDTLEDRHFFIRPFRTLGFESELEGGASYRLFHSFRVGASGYDVMSSGNQKIFSEVFQRVPGRPAVHMIHANAVLPNNGRVFETAFETVGPASLIRDHGYSAWVGFSPLRWMDLEAGYNRSVNYALDTFSFRVGVNAGSVVKHFWGPF